jgi:hypothetical protein
VQRVDISGNARRASAGSLASESGREGKKDLDITSPALEQRGFAGDRWYVPQGIKDEECSMIWFGSKDAEVLQFLQLTYSSSRWLCCDPGMEQADPIRYSASCTDMNPDGRETGRNDEVPGTYQPAISHSDGALCSDDGFVISEGVSGKTQALLKRRYYLVEKAKQASIVGILVGHGTFPKTSSSLKSLIPGTTEILHVL